MTQQRTTLYYTFGNHMHWADMEWLWGYHVLPGSVRDMLRYCAESGAKGQVNFDGIGYEKLAAEAPEALQALREAVAAGSVEVAGASYGQPYGLFHGGESNVRQRIYGVRSVLRLLGVRPRTFWEEEFDFFPQLPQILRGAGFSYAALFFQWTWHTPHLPQESAPAVWWCGQDGSRLLTAPRGPLNLHQWPEDFSQLLASELPRSLETPLVLQWLELMPSPDWMCRAELMLPQLESLAAHPAYDLKFVTLPEYLERVRPHAVERRYTLDDVFHGVSLGKNGDLFRRLSRRAEQSALTAESLAVLAGLFGRPYPSWDVYPTWELEEAWRDLLAAQHHDNDECEGLCGHVGRTSYERSLSLSGHVARRTGAHLAARTPGPPGRLVVFNPLGWVRDAAVAHPRRDVTLHVRDLPPFGYRVLDADTSSSPAPVSVQEAEDTVTLRRGTLAVTVDKRRGVVGQLESEHFPEGLLGPGQALADLAMTRRGARERFSEVTVEVGANRGAPEIRLRRRTSEGRELRITVRLAAEMDAVDLHFQADDLPRPDGGVAAALHTAIETRLRRPTLIHDHPYGLSEIRAVGSYPRKYPTGDWMTSPQVFEEVPNPFTALQLLDIVEGERGLLYLHDGSQAMLRDGDRVLNLLSMYDPWDEDYFVETLDVRTRLVPHGRLGHAQRWKLAQAFTRPALVFEAHTPGGSLPGRFGALTCDAPNVAVTALYRETEEAGYGLERYAGRGLGYPQVVRLVEFDGEASHARLQVPAEVARAYRTNLLGEIEVELRVERSGREAAPWSELEINVRPFEIATLYLDVVEGRKVERDLDAHRSVWATVHRREGGG